MASATGGYDERPAEDPDRLDQPTLALVADAAELLRNAAVVRDDAVDAVIRRVKAEAVIASLLATIGGSMGRVAQAAPELLGLVDPAADNEANGR